MTVEIEAQIATDKAVIERGVDGILAVRVPHPGVPFDLSDVEAVVAARERLRTSPARQRVLADVTTDPRPDKEARDYARTPEIVAQTRAMAMLVDGAMSQMLGNFYLMFARPDFPIRVFRDEAQAREWLLSLPDD